MPAGWPADVLEVGRIVEAWGLKGWIRVQPYAEPADALLGSKRWYLKPAETLARQVVPLPATVLNIGEVREHGDGLVATSAAIADRTAAEAFRGARIFVPRTSFPATGKDEFYWADLIGLEVVNRDRAVLGKVVGLIDTGSQGVLRILGSESADEILIPFVSAYVDSVDIGARRIIVDWGLDY
ncbi:MAG: ribosome maturation factor RimM [Caldimonas sp.]